MPVATTICAKEERGRKWMDFLQVFEYRKSARDEEEVDLLVFLEKRSSRSVSTSRKRQTGKPKRREDLIPGFDLSQTKKNH